MPDQSKIDDLLDRWEQAQDHGQPVSVESLCEGSPELVSVVQSRINALEQMRHWDVPTDTRAIANSTQQTNGLSLEGGSEPISGYKLEYILGQGGFGQVWKAQAPGEFPVALKFIQLNRPAAESELRSLEITRKIRHPNLLSTVGSWELSGWLVIAMELADDSLLDRLNKAVEAGHAGIPVDELGHYMLDAAKGIDHLNKCQHDLGNGQKEGVQHRDIKPQNLLLVGGSVKVADFGLALHFADQNGDHTGAMSVAYAAPEFFRGQTSMKSDQYSLAVTYCHLCGGRRPFEGSQIQIMRGHTQEAPDLSMLPEQERAVVGRALAKKPDQRWSTCRVFVRELLKTQVGSKQDKPKITKLPPVPPPIHADKRQTGVETQAIVGSSNDTQKQPSTSRRVTHRPKFQLSREWIVALSFALILFTIGTCFLVHSSSSNDEPDVVIKEPNARPKSKLPAQPQPTNDANNTKTDVQPQKKLIVTLPDVASTSFSPTKANELQQRWANFLGVPPRFQNSVGMSFALIPPGEFVMGSPQGDSRENDDTPHPVRITRPFYVGIHEVTIDEFRKFVDEEKYLTDSEKYGGRGYHNGEINYAKLEQRFSWQATGWEMSGRHPVINVSWNDAMKFCRWLSDRDDHVYRLPTEAEWEFACRAGTTTRFFWGDSRNDLEGNANFADQSLKDQLAGALWSHTWNDGSPFSTTCGSYGPNAFGLFDMHGNVQERCSDWYGADHYLSSPTSDPQGPIAGKSHAVRGGGWLKNGGDGSSSARHAFGDEPQCNVGFRVVLEVTLPELAEEYLKQYKWESNGTKNTELRPPATSTVANPKRPPASKSGLSPPRIVETASIPPSRAKQVEDYRDLGPSGSLLVGLKLTTGHYGSGYRYKAIASIQPIFRDADGKVTQGGRRGPTKAEAREFLAIPGYAIGALKVAQSGESRVVGIRIQFMRVIGDRLDPKDSYWSPTYSRAGNNLIGGDGRPVVGIKGTWAKQEQRSLALLLLDSSIAD